MSRRPRGPRRPVSAFWRLVRHRGIVNNIRHIQEITGIGKIHALVGGSHLGPAPAPHLAQVMDELQKIDLDYVVPMHCSGPNFVAAARLANASEIGLTNRLCDGKPVYIWGVNR